MNKTVVEANDYLQTLERWLSPSIQREVIIAPPFTLLGTVAKYLSVSGLGLELAAQNLHFGDQGAYTGEISATMLCDIGCRYVIVGHSERRACFHESDLIVHKKLKAAMDVGLIPILCVGETFPERQAGQTTSVIVRQLEIAMGDDAGERPLRVAYEPVWAIGTGETPTPLEVTSVHIEIGRFFLKRWGENARIPQIVYGGSVTENNTGDFIACAGIDGVLVGGASLSADRFIKIIESGTNRMLT